ncbi:hypothetical protein M670_00471 [Schinkia azotoformans MEV2011]|uniref:Uncharacterized protein n=1 Tax=Schinkia azotoformans MEV2011 TaxID=1348973 RepID=A0A072P4N2_SCHAZ|nr:hypothetical protein [Schinkia azotoformans]KEF40445.1 hypothetical protein M670_00471 [Schinkia azotoformans MEV2011]MEC1696145.1 hypothetical protein [Schinkia azotoformans]MEC1725352.1 hypothetical protein [Schinkia azotoformans]MEC1779463.1 hypothetical protein [Schinkia azotoformans]MED4330052.1 hypothetical protein [Schinkia azotoformans]
MIHTLNTQDPTWSCSLKKCTKCEERLPATAVYFNKNCQKRDGLTPRCKRCLNVQAKIYRENNKEKIKTTKQKIYERDKVRIISKVKKYRAENKEKIAEKKRVYHLQNIDRIKDQKKRYYKNHRKERSLYFSEYQRTRLKNDSAFRLKHNLRRRVHHALKGEIKSKKTLELIGCSVSYLKRHLEKQFKPGMSWDNYGEWHIDHIRPCATFDLSDPDQQKQCFHFTNLQPLWAAENLSKGSRWGRLQ